MPSLEQYDSQRSSGKMKLIIIYLFFPHNSNRAMKGFLVSAFLLALLFLPIASAGRHFSRLRTHRGHSDAQPRTKESMVAEASFYRERRGSGPGTVQIAGSSLPDCSHACGLCSPCRLVMVDEDEVYWRAEKGSEELDLSHNSTHVISQFTQCFANSMTGPKAWIGGLFYRPTGRRSEKFVDYPLEPHEEQRLQKLQERLRTPFDEAQPDHQEALRSLWNAAFPDVALKGLISDQWKDMGWQGPNPSTDFRGCGFISLENLLFLARIYPESFRRLLFKQEGKRATWEYPFAVAGINVSFMLIQMLDLLSDKPRCVPGINFVKLLGEDEAAFDVLYCIAFEMMDAQWLAMHASYMDFNNVLQVTRNQLERELALEDIHKIRDLPAYNLLYKL